MLLLLSRVFGFIIISTFHAFHVSVCEVYHNPDTKSLEISMKIFMNDIELAIQNESHAEFTLIGAGEPEEALLKAYVITHYKISVDGDEVDLNWVGYEIKGDALQCYLEGKEIHKISQIEFDDTLLTEVFEDQINLVHFQYKEEMKSLKATKDNPRQSIDTSEW